VRLSTVAAEIWLFVLLFYRANPKEVGRFKRKKMHRKKHFFRDVLTLNFQQKQLLSLST
jgi:hypothetical protein